MKQFLQSKNRFQLTFAEPRKFCSPKANCAVSSNAWRKTHHLKKNTRKWMMTLPRVTSWKYRQPTWPWRNGVFHIIQLPTEANREKFALWPIPAVSSKDSHSTIVHLLDRIFFATSQYQQILMLCLSTFLWALKTDHTYVFFERTTLEYEYLRRIFGATDFPCVGSYAVRWYAKGNEGVQVNLIAVVHWNI